MQLLSRKVRKIFLQQFVNWACLVEEKQLALFKKEQLITTKQSQLNAWKIFRSTFKASVESKDLEEPNNNMEDAPLSCQGCFFFDYNEYNPIVFCEK